MATTIEYALMAGASYISTRPDVNKFPVPQGWTDFFHVPNNPDYPAFTNASGFEAVSFTNGTEIVISFAGTYPGSLLGPTNLLGIPVDLVADAGLATGFGSEQLLQAAQYYLDVKASAPAGTTITLTGHSLGGGLAALVSVFFGVSATTFNQAPFANSAQAHSILNPIDIAPNVVAVLKSDLAAMLDANGNRIYNDAALSGLDSFMLARDANGGIPNSSLVNNIRVDGEFTSSLGVGIFDPIGNPATIITHGPHFSPSIDLHDQALLTSFLQSQQAVTNTPESAHTLSEATKKLTDLLGMIFDPKLYSFDSDKDKVNFLEHLVRHQTGGVDGVSAGGDGMITRFTADLWKLAQDGGMTMIESATYSNWNNVSKALIAFAMQTYYEENNANMTYGAELFTDLTATGTGSNGIRFDLHDVSKDIAAAMDSTNPNVKVDLAAKPDGKYILKGYEYFQAYLDTTGLLAPEERTLIKSMLPVLRDWYVQAGTGGMVATDTLNRGAFMLGGAGNDALAGGTKADLLVGNAGDDVLQGGGGSDVLLGGAGNDTYIYTTGPSAGLDTILDTGGQGSIAVDGATLAGGDQYGDVHVHRDANGHTYADVGLGIVIDGNIFVQGWQAGNLGLSMNTTPVADVPPIIDNTIYGTAQNPLSDTVGNDHIIGGGGFDVIYATRGGDNFVEAGGGPGYSVSNPTGDAANPDLRQLGDALAANDEAVHTWRVAA